MLGRREEEEEERETQEAGGDGENDPDMLDQDLHQAEDPDSDQDDTIDEPDSLPEANLESLKTALKFVEGVKNAKLDDCKLETRCHQQAQKP